MISRRLTAAGVGHALGGTGLLYSMGFAVKPRDWDLLTDAPLGDLRSALADLNLEVPAPNPDYPSDYLVQIRTGTCLIEIIGRFAIRTADGIVRIPSRVAGMLHGVPLGDPADWLRAYRAMARVDPDGHPIDGEKIRMLESLRDE